MDRTRTDRTETRAEGDEHEPSTTSCGSTTMLDRSDRARLVVDCDAAGGRGLRETRILSTLRVHDVS